MTQPVGRVMTRGKPCLQKKNSNSEKSGQNSLPPPIPLLGEVFLVRTHRRRVQWFQSIPWDAFSLRNHIPRESVLQVFHGIPYYLHGIYLGTVGLHHGIQSHGGLNPVWLRATALSYAEVAQKRQTLLTAVLWTGGKVATLNIQRNILGGI